MENKKKTIFVIIMMFIIMIMLMLCLLKTGKCSHGGAVDQTSLIEPKGGINKDTLESNHGFLHRDAADLAIAATRGLLEDIRKAAGDRPFLECVCASVHASPSLPLFSSFPLLFRQDVGHFQKIQ